ncbi:hypothetical protein PPERSA_08841 [Pseudocohnilembus persalinus]|uniref:DJ-1/PfpI domain-containing protein n=1 Tax=Pseudocohnilembus persalinus TaxID=266149 RepID=A0A0V0R4G6_PSEPJ|nr:hypothetical protein PPERSA_08841 [Pseudocohnilembus persalinus]|eukprot:KRX09125.1 hypothetical protein PPERSA_08841 [Pseudocohnilembus persalinus]
MAQNQCKMEVLVPIADGFEEVEALSIVDVLRRAGANVTLASIMGLNSPNIIKSARNVKILTDDYFENCENLQYDLIACPGGMPNAEHLGNHKGLIEKLKKQKQQQKWIAAICASPYYVLQKNGLMDGEEGTCFPGLHDKFNSKSKINERVVVSNKLITSQGAGTSLEFSIMLVEKLFSPEKAIQLAKSMVIKR